MIYKISIEAEFYFRGETPPQQCDVAEVVCEILQMGEAEMSSRCVNSITEVPVCEQKLCPYGNNNEDKTLKEWLSE
jgi:hypothetical protein